MPGLVRVRAPTVGLDLASLAEEVRVEAAARALDRVRAAFEEEGYEVQTRRVAIPPLADGLAPEARAEALGRIQALDRIAAEAGLVLGLGPVLSADRDDPDLADWAVELVRTTRATSFSVAVTAGAEVHPAACRTAARIMVGVAAATPRGLGNFRFAAAAGVPPGTPFFPVATHRGPDALAIGLESAPIVQVTFAALSEGAGTERPSPATAVTALAAAFDRELAPVAAIGARIAASEGWVWTGIDPSPAPGKDRSIGAGIEAWTRRPFGSPSTLTACRVVTDALRRLSVRTCGYAGLMLPVLEDEVLARRAAEGRYGLAELLLDSSVCGTGLDVVPIPGDTPVEGVEAVILDVAALAAKLGKPLSARLLLAPGKRAGERTDLADDILTDSTVFAVD